MKNQSCLAVLILLILSSLSAFTEEELTLDEENSSPSIKSPVKSQNETTQKSVPPSEPPPQLEKRSPFLDEMTALFEKKQYSKITPILWAKIDVLNRAEMLLLVKAHYYNKEYTESIKAANLMLAKNEKDEEILTLLGLNYLKRKKDREAKEFFKKATDVNPVYSPALDGLAEIYEKNSNYYELRLIYQDLIKKLGEKPELLKKLCDINTKDGVNDAAIENCRKGMLKDPKTAANFVNLGIVYKNMGEQEKAKQQLSLAAQKFPSSDLAQMQYAIFLEDQKNYIEAYKFYNSCNKANNYIERCWVGLAVTSYQMLKFKEAYDAMKKSCSFNRKHSIIGRKAALQARNAKQSDWAKKFESLADICGN